MTTPDVLIIGAGITGVSAALELIEAGASVEVIDRHGPAAMASGWTLAGVRQSGRDPAELPLAQAAVALWKELDDRLDARTGYWQSGNMRLARNPAEADCIRALVAEQTTVGLSLDLLEDLADIRAVVPGLSDIVELASWCPSDGQADPIATVTAYVNKAKQLGARFCNGEAALELTAKGNRIDHVVTRTRIISPGMIVLAAGLEINRLLGPLGHAIPLVRPLVTVLRSAPCTPVRGPVLGVANADMAARQESSGRLRVTGGAREWQGEISERDGKPVIHPPAKCVLDTITKVSAVLPAFAEAEIESIWGGALDLTPDALPVIDRVPEFENLVIAAGFSGHGFGIGPVTGQLAADLALKETPRHALDSFRFGRFTSQTKQAPLTLHG